MFNLADTHFFFNDIEVSIIIHIGYIINKCMYHLLPFCLSYNILGLIPSQNNYFIKRKDVFYEINKPICEHTETIVSCSCTATTDTDFVVTLIAHIVCCYKLITVQLVHV